MTDDNVNIFRFFTHNFSYATGNITMGCTMEAIFTDAMFFVHFVRQCVYIVFSRHCLVESCIKYSYLRCIRHDSLACFDTLQISWVMEWAQWNAFFNSFDDSFIDNNGFCKFHTTMQYTVTYSSNFIHGFNHAVFRVNEDVEYKCKGYFVVFHRLRNGVLLSVWTFVSEDSIYIRTNAFYQTLCQHAFIRHVNQLVLQGRRTAVYY